MPETSPILRMVLLIVALIVLFLSVLFSFFSSRIALPGIFSKASVSAENMLY